jgi:pre-mRNA-processing factor 19
VSKKSGLLYEQRLIEQYIEQHGTEPGTGEVLTADDLLPVKTSRIVRPRPATLTSIPALLSTLQNEWDAVAQSTRTLQEELARTREELTTALYQNDAAERVIVRLLKERNDARDALSKVTVSGDGAVANGDSMAIDSVQELPEDLAAKVDETHQTLSKSRKKRPIPDGWITSDEVPALATEASTSLPFSQITAVAMHEEGAYASVSSREGVAAVYSLDQAKVERQLEIKEPITDGLWTGARLIFSTAKGSVKVFENGQEKASLSEHAGPVTGLALHPSGAIFASVGSDKNIVFYDMDTLKPAARAYTGAGMPPLFAAHGAQTLTFAPIQPLPDAPSTQTDTCLLLAPPVATSSSMSPNPSRRRPFSISAPPSRHSSFPKTDSGSQPRPKARPQSQYLISARRARHPRPRCSRLAAPSSL